MRVPSTLRRGEVGFNMTPMIDVVFLLIIFFLVSSHLVKQENQMQLPLPEAKQGERIADDQSRPVVVNVKEDGELISAGSSITPDQLINVLSERRTRGGTDIEVRIRCNRNVPYLHVEPIMLACTKAGIWNVTFSVIRPQESS